MKQVKRRFPALVLIYCSLLVSFTIGFPPVESICSEGMPPKSISHKDKQVGTDSNNKETNPSMVFSQSGDLYLAFEAETSYGNSYILLYCSDNNGQTWDSLTPFTDPAADLREPSLSIGENTLLMAYISDDGTSSVPRVATADISVSPVVFTTHSVPVTSSYEGHLTPEIITDYASGETDWYAYLVCEAASSDDSHDILYWISQDKGETWKNRNHNSSFDILFGQSDATNWRDPDLAYSGSHSLGGLYVVGVNDRTTVQGIWGLSLGHHGYFYEEAKSVLTLGGASSFGIPHHAVDPDIASSGFDLLVACTVSSDGNDDIVCCRKSWSAWPTELLQGQTPADEFAPALSSSGGSFHLIYTNIEHEVFYTQLPKSRYETWQTEPVKINDTPYASIVYTKKAIASDWQCDRANIAWSDYRDGGTDYDIFTDYITWPSLVPVFLLLLNN